MKLTVVISAYNAEKKLEKVLHAVKFADEIIVVDNSSTDKTLEIARRYTKHVFKRSNNPMLNVNKNFGFTKARGDWILYLDHDEEVTSELAEEIKKVTKEEGVVGYWIPRKNIIFGKWIQNSIWWPDYQLRLFRNGKGKFPEVHVHEAIEISGDAAYLKEPLVHHSYQTIAEYVQKMNNIYTENEAKNILLEGKKVSWVDAVRFPANDFLKTFFLQKGYQDGLHGLVLSLLQAFYAEVVFAKVWEKQGFADDTGSHFLEDFYKECVKIYHEFQYWFMTSFIERSKNPLRKLHYKVKRKNATRKLR